MTNPSAKTVELVWSRDQGSCVRCGAGLFGVRGVTWHVHHRRPRGSGGSKEAWVNMPANLLSLCRDCHIHIESFRAEARSHGWLVPLNGVLKASEVPVRHYTLGLVLLDDLGSFTNQEVPF